MSFYSDKNANVYARYFIISFSLFIFEVFIKLNEIPLFYVPT